MENSEPELLTGMIPTNEGLVVIDALQIGLQIWRVPSWRLSPDGRMQWPERAIRADTLGCQRGNVLGHQFLLAQPIPTTVLDGHTSLGPHGEYEVVEEPDTQAWSIPVRKVH